MITSFVSTTDLQRRPKEVFASEEPFRFIMNNNKPVGMLLTNEVAAILGKSGVFDQIREELWEMNDPETVEQVRQAREGDFKDGIELSDFRKQYRV